MSINKISVKIHFQCILLQMQKLIYAKAVEVKITWLILVHANKDDRPLGK